MIDADNRIGFLPQLNEPLDFPRAGEKIGDEQIGDAGGGKNFGLAELGAGQADRSGFEQAAADVGRFVALGVRTPGDAALPAEGRSFGDVGLELVEVDEQGRSVELFLGRPQWNKHKRLVGFARTNRVRGG